jgi:hypothetical protein
MPAVPRGHYADLSHALEERPPAVAELDGPYASLMALGTAVITGAEWRSVVVYTLLAVLSGSVVVTVVVFCAACTSRPSPPTL